MIIAQTRMGLRVKPLIKHFAHTRIGRRQYARAVGNQISRRVQTRYTDNGRIERSCQTLHDTRPDTQSGERARPLRINDATQIRRAYARLFEQHANLRQDEF